MTHYYFAYGMNTNLDSMAHRCPTAICMGAAQLEGYKFVFRRHADVELSDPESFVDGVLWQLQDADLDSLDQLEGFPNYYLRCKAWVKSESNEWVKAWIYFMQEQDYISYPAQAYVSMCREGYEQNGVNTRQIDEALDRIDYDYEVDYMGFQQV